MIPNNTDAVSKSVAQGNSEFPPGIDGVGVFGFCGQRARKGIFMTKSDYSRDAEDYVARLMIDFGVGVTPVSTYEVKKLDSDCFETT